MNYQTMLNPTLFPSEHMDKYEEFMNQYGDKPESYILEEISRVKNLVSPEILQKYINDISLFSKMNAFMTDTQRQKIDMIQNMLQENLSPSYSQSMQQSVPTSQSFGTSLLLWFLILVAIWPRSGPHHKPYPPRRPRPYRPYRPYRPFPFF